MSLRDMFDGGGMGRSGDKFEGGPFSAILNALGVKPLGYHKRQEAMRAGARPRPSYIGRPSSSGAAAPAGPPLGSFDPAGAPSAGTIERHRTSYNQQVADDQARMFDMTQGAPIAGAAPNRMGAMTARGLPEYVGPPLGSQPGAPRFTLPVQGPANMTPAEMEIAQYLASRGALGPRR